MDAISVGFCLFLLGIGNALLGLACIVEWFVVRRLRSKVERLDRILAQHLALDDRYECVSSTPPLVSKPHTYERKTP